MSMPSSNTLTRSEIYHDPLMSQQCGMIIPGDYTPPALLKATRLQRIDEIHRAMKEQGLIHEFTQIDRPLQRHAFAALLEPIYQPHYPRLAMFDAERHGRNYATVEAAALHYFLMKHGFTRETSLRYLENRPEDADDIAEAKRYASSFAVMLWDKYGSDEGLPLLREPRHAYDGERGLSGLAKARQQRRSWT